MNSSRPCPSKARRGAHGFRLLAVAGIVWFGNAVPAGGVSVTRGPYLQQGTSTNIVVRWRTSEAATSRVRCGASLATLDLVTDDLTPKTEHEIQVTGLSPDTAYYYSIGSVSEVLAGGDLQHRFTTAPVPGTARPVRVWVIGDFGTGDGNQLAVRDAYASFTGTRGTDLWLMLGDNAYELGSDAEYQTAVFDVYGDLLRTAVAWPTLGNHDTAFSTAFNDAYPYFAIFTLPKNGEAGGLASGSEHYYSFDYANVHFICLDSMTANRATNGAMANWLRTDLDATTNRWIVAYWHHPPYSKGSHDSDFETELVEMRENFLPILENGGVDVVLAGHSHSYERSFLLDGHYGTSATLAAGMILNTNSGREDQTGPYLKTAGGPVNHQGAVYAVVGSSGKVPAGGALNHPAMFVSLNQLGSLVLDFNTNRLDAKFIRENGFVHDYFSLVKEEVRLSDARVSEAGAFETTLTSVAAGKSNVIEASTDFSDWVSLATNVSSSNSFPFIDPDAVNYPARFYRVRRLP